MQEPDTKFAGHPIVPCETHERICLPLRKSKIDFRNEAVNYIGSSMSAKSNAIIKLCTGSHFHVALDSRQIGDADL